jgi:hypothetical protein
MVSVGILIYKLAENASPGSRMYENMFEEQKWQILVTPRLQPLLMERACWALPYLLGYIYFSFFIYLMYRFIFYYLLIDFL